MPGVIPSGSGSVGQGIPGYGSQQGGNPLQSASDWLASAESGVASALEGPGPDQPAVLGPASIEYEKKQKADQKKAAAEAKAKGKEEAQVKAEEAQIRAVENSPWTKLSNALVSEYQQEQTPVAAAVGGAGIPQAQESAASGALGLLGLSPSSGAGQWLAAQTAAGQAASAPVAAAMRQEGAQYAAEQGPISAALAAYGQANALNVSTAPEQSWLSALASHITSNLSYQGVVPQAALPELSPAVTKALQLSGGYGGSTGSGTVPIQNVAAAATGGSKATGAGGYLAGSVPQTGIVPAATTNAG